MTATLVAGFLDVRPMREDDPTDPEGWLNVEFWADGHRAKAELAPRFGGSLPAVMHVYGVEVIDAGCRGRGIGTALMANLARHADANEWELELSCETHLVGFYEKAGFKVTRVRHYDDSSGYPDVAEMTRERT